MASDVDDDLLPDASGPAGELTSDRGLVRIWRDARTGRRVWSVSVRTGESAESVLRAREIAREVELLLAAEDPPPPQR
jgi:hypothetical protein